MLSSAPTLVDVDRVSFGYERRRAVEDISFTIGARDFTAIIGPNGSGKSTLVKLIVGLLVPESGTITRFIAANRIGYVPQYIMSEHHFPATVREILALPVAAPKAKARAPDRPCTLADIPPELALAELIDRQFATCSVGQQQRVLIALALLHNPALLILDEPTAGVDIEAKRRFYDLLTRLNADGIAIILITHEVSILPPVIRRVLCINTRICCHGTLHQLPHMLKQVYGDYMLHQHTH